MADIRLLFNKSSAKTKRRKIDSDDDESAKSSNLLAPTSDIDDGDTRELAREIVHTGQSQLGPVCPDHPDDAPPESLSQSDLALDSEIDCCEVDVAEKSDGDCETEQAEDANDNTSASVSGKV